jgi:aryl-alcohol dehydrogenase-like predicted oxidoreductase
MHIIDSVEGSLRRLQTDHIDLYQVHGWDGHTALEQTVSALSNLVQSGKVRYLGCSNMSAWHVMKALATADAMLAERFVSQQIYYSLIGREAEHELIPLSVDQGLGNLIWSPLAGGLLAATMQRGRDDERVKASWDPPVPDIPRFFDIHDTLKDVSAQHGATPAQVSLAYILTKNITSAILGPRTEDHMTSALAAASINLTVEDVSRLDEVSRQPLPYPYWHQALTVTDRLSAADATLLSSDPAV